MSSFQPPRTVDDVEKPPPLDHGTTLCRGPFEDLGVDRVLFRHPGVELGRVAEPVLFVGAGPGHVPVQRHRDIGDHLRHCGLPSATICSADRAPTADSSRRPDSLLGTTVGVECLCTEWACRVLVT